MDNSQLYIARLIFKNKIYSLNGNSFEDFFSAIMYKSDSRFIQIKPQGSIGDRKNDGFIKELGHYFQVYSPEKPTESDGKGAKKAIEDFEGLYNFWNDKCEIKKFSFVFNDKYKGIYPDIESALLDLGNKYTNVEFNVLHMNILEDIFLKLSSLDITSILGFIPNINSIELSLDALNEVIDGFNNGDSNIYEDKLTVPDFDKKIQFNGLTDKIKPILEKGGYDIGLLEEFFNKTSNKTLRNFVKDVLRGYYENGLENGLEGDVLFFEIYEKSVSGKKVNKSISDAVFVLMSYYFESCDIFKEPN